MITHPAEIPPMLKLSEEDFARQTRFPGAARLFGLGRLSSDKAAHLAGLAGMDWVAFLYELDRIGVPAITLLRDEGFEAEIPAAKELSG